MQTPAQRAFIFDECFALTLGGTVQRAGVYKRGLSEKERLPLHKSLRRILEDISKLYSSQVNEENHIKNIQHIVAEITLNHQDILSNGKLRIGHAQKALNLYLKYLWCLGEIPMPPHCPIDSIVLRHIPSFAYETWTQLDDISLYRDIITAAKQQAGNIACTMGA
jgi:hypothetical protein